MAKSFHFSKGWGALGKGAWGTLGKGLGDLCLCPTCGGLGIRVPNVGDWGIRVLNIWDWGI